MEAQMSYKTSSTSHYKLEDRTSLFLLDPPCWQLIFLCFQKSYSRKTFWLLKIHVPPLWRTPSNWLQRFPHFSPVAVGIPVSRTQVSPLSPIVAIRLPGKIFAEIFKTRSEYLRAVWLSREHKKTERLPFFPGNGNSITAIKATVWCI